MKRRHRCASRSIRMPTEIDQLERRATQLEIEKQALKKEDDRELAKSGWQ